MKKLLLTVLVLIAPWLVLLLLSSRTTLSIDPPLRVIGSDTPVKVRVSNPHGLRHFKAMIEQNGARRTVFESSAPATRVLFWRKRVHPHDISFRVGKKQAAEVRNGKAKLVIQAQSNDLRGRTDWLAIDIDVITEPPRVTADNYQHYVNQGGSELVVFSVSGYWTEAGVKVGSATFRSYPYPGGGANQRFALFAFPWDTPAGTVPVVYARNPAGAEVTARFWCKVFPKRFRSRELEVTDSFLEKVVNQIDPGGAGDLLSRFLKINGEFRRRDNQQLRDLRLKTEENFLWTGPFLQLANSQVESQFADRRTYVYKGKKVDEQVHLGFDLAVTQNVPVVAANDGRVIYASDLGIYGNCVVIDHGYGLQSIYGHLNSIAVKPGEMVKKRQELGKSGSTGLAGGDHLHFSMQVDGAQVNAVEWWDEHWIRDRIWSKFPHPAAATSAADGLLKALASRN